MKNNIIILAFLCPLFLFGQHNAQNIKLLWGDTQKDSRILMPAGLVGYDDTGIYTIKVEKSHPSIYAYDLKSIVLEHYDNDMNLTKSYQINPKAYSKKNAAFERIIQVGKKMYLFVTFKQKGDNILYVQGIDKQTLRPKPNLKKISKVNYRGTSKSNSGYFDYQISTDTSKVLIYYKLPFSNSKEERFGFHVYDDDFNLLWEKGVTLPYKDKSFRVNSYRVDNTGNVYMSGRVREYASEFTEIDYRYSVLGFFDDGNTVRRYKPEIEGKHIKSMIIKPDTDGQHLICTGFYSDNRSSGISGSYFMKIDLETQKISVNKHKAFEVDLMTQNMKKSTKNRIERRAEKDKDVGIKGYHLKLIWNQPNGNVTLIGEQHNGYRPGLYNSRLTYNRCNDIIAVNMSSDGEVQWTHKISKKQFAANGKIHALSHAYSLDINDKLYFIFNDLPQNLSLANDEVPVSLNGDVLSGNLRQSVAVLVEIDKNGKKTKRALFSADQADIYIQPVFYRYTRNNEMTLLGKKGDKHRYIKVILDK